MINSNFNVYDVHVVLSCLANSIHDVNTYDKKADLGLLRDYKVTYYKLKKILLLSEKLDNDTFDFVEVDNKCGKL